MLKSILIALSILVLHLPVSVGVQAAPITITFEATASGELDGVVFTDEAFVVTATGDTDNRFAFSNGFTVPSDFTQITFGGLNGGSPIDIFSPVLINVNTEFDVLTLGNDELGDLDFLILEDPQIDGYELLGPLDPITGAGFVSEFGTPLETSAGRLFFDDGGSDVTVTVIPEPGTLALVGLGGLTVLLRRAKPGLA